MITKSKIQEYRETIAEAATPSAAHLINKLLDEIERLAASEAKLKVACEALLAVEQSVGTSTEASMIVRTALSAIRGEK